MSHYLYKKSVTDKELENQIYKILETIEIPHEFNDRKEQILNNKQKIQELINDLDMTVDQKLSLLSLLLPKNP